MNQLYALPRSCSSKLHPVWVVCWLLGLLAFSLSAQAQCSFTVKPAASGCYQSGGSSKATVSVEVAWSNAPASDYIVVTTRVQSRTITPGQTQINYGFGVSTQAYTIFSPQVVAFEVPANGAANQSITVAFATSSTCMPTGSFDVPAACPSTACVGNNVAGMVFNDFNADGIKQAGETSGIPGVLVSAYDCAGVIRASLFPATSMAIRCRLVQHLASETRLSCSTTRQPV